MAGTGSAQLITWLEDQGHSQEEIATILEQVTAYDEKTVHESIFDSIESGSVNLAELIRDAAREAETPNKPK